MDTTVYKTFYKLYSDYDIKLIDKAENIVGKIKDEDGYISFDKLMDALDSLVDKYEGLQEEFEEYKDYVKENYKRID